jgi:hypothetical protein
MAKKLTAAQRDIARLSSQYQSQLSSLTPEYESLFARKQSALEAGAQKTSEYTKKLEEFNKQLAEYQKNPRQNLTFGRGVMASPDAGPNVKIQPNKQYDWRSQTMYRIPELNNDYYTPYALEQLGYEVNANAAGTLAEAFKRNEMPKFTEEAPEGVDLSAFEKETAALEEKKSTFKQGFDREVAERKSGRLGAISQRSQSRPMLSKGVTL